MGIKNKLQDAALEAKWTMQDIGMKASYAVKEVVWSAEGKMEQKKKEREKKLAEERKKAIEEKAQKEVREEQEKEEQEKRKKQERIEDIESLGDILKWTPFCKYNIIGFRRINVLINELVDLLGLGIYSSCGKTSCVEYLELVSEEGMHFYLYHNDSTIKNLDELGVERMSGKYPKKSLFYYSPYEIKKLADILGILIPQFGMQECCNKGRLEGDSERRYKKTVCDMLQCRFTLDSAYIGNFITKEEISLINDDVYNYFRDIIAAWKKQSYAQEFEIEPYEAWKKELQEVENAVVERENEKAKVNEEIIKHMAAQQYEEEQKAKQEAGEAGEQEVEYQLKWLPKEYMAVEKKTSGILLAHPDFGNEKQEIDHIVVGPQGVFLIETKAYSGTIRIDAQGNWTRSKGDGVEEGLRNPVAQVNRHHLVVEKILGVSEIYDIICIANDKSIIEGAENSVVPVVKSDMLGHYISNYKKDSDKRYNEEEVKELKAKLESSMLENEA